MPKQTKDLILEILQLFDLNEDALNELCEIYEPIAHEDSVVFAIFIPKHIIDKVMYLSYGFYDPVSYQEMLPSMILEKYRTNMLEIAPYKTLEGRLVFTQRYLLNPFSGIKFFRHHVINQKHYTEYQEKLKHWAKENLKK